MDDKQCQGLNYVTIYQSWIPGYPDQTLTADTKMGPISQSQMSLTFRKYNELSFNILNVNILSIAFLSAWDSFSTFLAMIFDNNSYISVYFKRDSFLYHFFYPWYLCDFSFCDKCDTDTEWKIIANLAKCSFAKKLLWSKNYPGSICEELCEKPKTDIHMQSIMYFWSWQAINEQNMHITNI